MQKWIHRSMFTASAAALTLLAACGGGTENSEETDSSEEESTQEESSGDTVTYEGPNGSFDIPADPQNIVVLAPSYVGYFLALDEKPIGATTQALENPYFDEEMTEGIEDLGDGTSVEQVLSLEPDLIVTLSSDENLEQLQDVAPTVTIDYGQLPFKEQLQEFGTMTGEEEAAEAWITEWDESIEANRASVEESVGDRTISLIQPFEKGVYVFGNTFARGGEIIYDEFGLAAPDAVQEDAIDSGEGFVNVSLEALDDYAGDIIFTSPWQESETGSADEVYDSNVWQNLPAVQEDNVYELDTAASFFNDPVSLESQLDFVVESLEDSAE
ncbi:iron complex transport system substrate-binding protein [Sinobaca qinghaiensis]|uniref:Iron complex transport system substrate-binding protein n=1 Tax=Sinobaca qinghaiensis TaxID=342944 RepID=A0A419V8N0_9BACL|nr:ABC transporter substrate-binding protein [Sinobaca qinghaiensis]RKD76425.1 iron complex transport system substrate-binding protein [Sinobaca qinghaiensis]